MLLHSVNNGINWNQLTVDIKQEDISYLKSIKSPFLGDLSHLYIFEKPKETKPEEKAKEEKTIKKGLKENEEEVEEEEGDEEREEEADQQLTEEEIEAKKKKELEESWHRIPEEVRLSYVISCIDHDTSVCPRGAFTLNFSDEVVPNQTFAGLDLVSAGKLVNYVHLRKPEKLQAKSLLEKEFLDKRLDFVDNLDEDVPKSMYTCL